MHRGSTEFSGSLCGFGARSDCQGLAACLRLNVWRRLGLLNAFIHSVRKASASHRAYKHISQPRVRSISFCGPEFRQRNRPLSDHLGTFLHPSAPFPDNPRAQSGSASVITRWSRLQILDPAPATDAERTIRVPRIRQRRRRRAHSAADNRRGKKAYDRCRLVANGCGGAARYPRD